MKILSFLQKKTTFFILNGFNSISLYKILKRKVMIKVMVNSIFLCRIIMKSVILSIIYTTHHSNTHLKIHMNNSLLKNFENCVGKNFCLLKTSKIWVMLLSII